jgi:hypothetical protein
LETGNVPSTTLSQRIPDSSAKARPEPVLVFCVGVFVVVHVLGEVVFEYVEWCFRKDADALVPGIRSELYMRSSRMMEESGRSMLYNKESRQIRYLGEKLASL